MAGLGLDWWLAMGYRPSAVSTFPAFTDVTLSGSPRPYTHEVFGDSAGYIIEEAVTNGVSDSSFSNSNTLPSGWGLLLYSQPATVSFTKTGSSKRVLTLSGNAVGDVYFMLGAPQGLSISSGDRVTGSLKIRKSGGSMTNLANPSLLIYEHNSDGSLGNFAPIPSLIQLLQEDVPFWEQVSITAGSYSWASLGLKITASGAFNVSFEIWYPQIEKRDWRTTWTETTRSADVVTHSLPSYPWSIQLKADSPRYQESGTLWEAGSGSSRITIRHEKYKFYLTVVSSGTTVVDSYIGMIPPLYRFTACVSAESGKITISLCGKTPQVFNVTLPTVSNAKLGSGENGYWNSSAFTPSLASDVLTSSETQAKASEVNGFFDDFDRADSTTLGTSPTGHTWDKTNTLHTSSEIVGKKFIASKIDTDPSGAYAAYGRIFLASNPRYIGGLADFKSGSGGGAITFLAAQNDSQSPVTSLHSIFTSSYAVYQTINSNVILPILATYTYAPTIAVDGMTYYGFAALLNEIDDSMVYLMPNGGLQRFVSTTFQRDLGSTLLYEHYWQENQCIPEYLAVAAS